jgi:hypothetical protein
MTEKINQLKKVAKNKQIFHISAYARQGVGQVLKFLLQTVKTSEE